MDEITTSSATKKEQQLTHVDDLLFKQNSNSVRTVWSVDISLFQELVYNTMCGDRAFVPGP